MISTSGKLTLAALTDTTTSPAPARGEASSSTTSESGGPYSRQRTAFMSSIISTGGIHAHPASACVHFPVGRRRPGKAGGAVDLHDQERGQRARARRQDAL